jgi:hypothetical protein
MPAAFEGDRRATMLPATGHRRPTTWAAPSFGKGFDHADVCKGAHAAAAQGESDLSGTKRMKPVAHRPALYIPGPDKSVEARHRLLRIAELSRQAGAPPLQNNSIRERNWWTATLDALLLAIWRYAPPLHWAWVIVIAVGFFIYARLVALTIHLTVTGERLWPEVPRPAFSLCGTAVQTRG